MTDIRVTPDDDLSAPIEPDQSSPEQFVENRLVSREVLITVATVQIPGSDG